MPVKFSNELGITWTAGSFLCHFLCKALPSYVIILSVLCFILRKEELPWILAN
jgi:hypothetical protein